MLPVIPLKEAALLAAFLIGLLAVSKLDFDSALVSEKIVQESPRPFVEPLFTHPLPWAATVEQRMHYRDEPKVRYYVPKDTK